MRFDKSLSLKLTSTVLFSFLFISCSSIAPGNIDYVSSLQMGQTDDTPKSVVIMPFDNDTSENGIELLIRKSFYNHFSSKNYRDYELNEVDRGLKILEDCSSTLWRDMSPTNIGKFFQTDYVIYGRVKEYKKIFLGIYSQIVLEVKLSMVSTENGKVVWERTVRKRSHEGGIPFNPLDLVPAALRSGFHMKEDKTIELVDRVNSELAEQIPEPNSPPVAKHVIEIQVASFLEDERAQQTLKEFEGKGFNTRIETVKLGDRYWYRIILGPYYNQPEADEIKDRIERNTQFKPIFIHYYPEMLEKEDLIRHSEAY